MDRRTATAPHLAAAGHPRPQLVRDPDWTDLGGPWGFAYDDADTGRADRWQDTAGPFDRTVTVPYPPESELSGIHDPAPHPVVWYRRGFTAAPPPTGRRLLLHFGAVDHTAEVWVNGHLAGGHQGGHTGFTLDVTGALDPSGAQVVTVRAEDRPEDCAQPRGKQDWRPRPHTIWYHRTTGIWQPVWLEEVPEVRVESLHWAADLPGARVRCEIALNRAPDLPHTVRVELRLGGEVLAVQTARTAGRELHLDVAVPALRHGQDLDRLLWSPQAPHLVDAEVHLLDGGGRAVDRVASYLGLRTVSTADGRFLLNGSPLFLRFALEQGYWPRSHLAAPPGELRREVELAREAGLNGVRVHQKIEDPRFLYWCDRLGLLVWEEMPSAYEFGPTAMRRALAEWTAAVNRDRSHPCVMAWVPVNESWGVPHQPARPEQRHFADALYHLTKALDPTRPAVSNDGWEISSGDFWGVHDYTQDAEVLRRRYGREALRDGPPAELWPGARRLLLGAPARDGRPVVLSEFGGVTYPPRQDEDSFGYSTAATEQEYARTLAALVDACLDSGLAGYCYTQFTDTEQEANGLLTEDRAPKLPMDRLREVLGRQPRGW